MEYVRNTLLYRNETSGIEEIQQVIHLPMYYDIFLDATNHGYKSMNYRLYRKRGTCEYIIMN